MRSFKRLYGLDKKGGFKVWSIWTENGQLFIEHGKESGKLQLKQETIVGKNLGRSNETTPAQQAELEAQSRINKQIDKGYRENKSDLESLPLLPMLAQDYLKQGHRIKYPCWVSPKLDGVRCLAFVEDGEVVLLSRGGKYYTVPHIQSFLGAVLDKHDIVDGEIYVHGKYLEEIVSAVKKPNELTPELEFIAFDVFTDDVFHERLKKLDTICDRGLKAVPYEKCTHESEMKIMHDVFVEQGFEGIMLRNRDGLYESGKRSADLQKYKRFFDDEFEIVNIKEDRNGNAVFTVKNKFADNEFNVTYGNFETRERFLKLKNEIIGQYITIKYQTLYKDTKIPQFPVGVALRDYE